jgi:ATP-binding cassette subfamily B protein
MSAVVQESLTGVRVVRAYRQEAAEIQRFRQANLDYLEHNRRLSRLQGAFFPTMSLLLGFGALLALWLGSRAVMSGRITVGQLVAFNAYWRTWPWPMIAFGWVTNLLQQGMASWKRMLQVMDTEPHVRDEGSGLKAQRLRCVGCDRCGGLAAEAASGAGAAKAGAAIDGSPLDVRLWRERGAERSVVLGQGRRHAGHRGRHRFGKVDARSICCRGLYNPPRGTGVHRRPRCPRHPARELRTSIGFVPQEPFLFSDTLAANVALGVPGGATQQPERIRAAGVVGATGQGRGRLSEGYERWWGSAALRCPAGRNSALPSPARWSSTRAS